MKPSKFLSSRLVDKLIQPLLETFKLMFLTMNYSLTERQILDLMKNDDFNNVFEICIRDSLKDYQNTTISYFELYNNIKFNIGSVYSFVEKWLDNGYICND